MQSKGENTGKLESMHESNIAKWMTGDGVIKAPGHLGRWKQVASILLSTVASLSAFSGPS